jgi:conjugative transfer pilus assembly protein TraH
MILGSALRLTTVTSKLLFVLTVIASITNTAYADVSGDLNNFFNNAGFASNVTVPSSYQGQEAGYYSGGSLVTRTKSRYVQPVGITMPSINAGCGGVDIFNGGMSFINGHQINEFAQSIMTNAAGYTMHLALATWAPQINQVLQFVQDQAQQINQFGMSSCQASQAMVGGLWAMAGQNMRQVCQDMGTASNKFEGWVQSTEGCKDNPGSTFADGQSKGLNKDDLQPSTNITWNALKNGGIVGQDAQLAEFLMTVAGTIVLDKDANPHYYAPEYANGTIINALIQGGDAEIYVCDETDKCLNPTKSKITISANNSLMQLTYANISQLETNLESDTPLSSNMLAFISSVSLPVMTILQSVVMTGQSPESIVNSLSEYLAYYLLNHYLQWSLNTVMASANSLNISKEVMSEYLNNIHDGQKYLQQDMSAKAQAFANMLNGLMINNQIMRQVMGKATTRQIENLEFSSGE